MSAWTEKKTMEGMSYYFNSSSQEITWTKPEELQTEEEKELSQGDWTWVPHPVHLWQAAQKVRVNDDGSADTRTEAGTMVHIPADGMIDGPLTNGKKVHVPMWPLQKTSLRFQEDDLVMLDQLNEALIMYNFRTRYADNQLYTWVGAARSVLVAVNPYKNLPLYGDDRVELYRFKPPNTKLDPHVFDIANDAYNSLLFSHKNQSILISGESGAGKTVATKHCLKFLAQVAGSERNVEERVVLANPLLEAFGNAQTIRNNNSSRFGKWIQIFFDSSQRCIVSAEIINYLLEKSRIVAQQKGERNYHVFYQLTKDPGMKSKYNLSGPETYRYTNVSGTYDALHIDDLEELNEVQTAMTELGFTEEEKDFLFGIAASILNLGNCEFDAKAEKNNVNGSQLKGSSKDAVQNAAKLLGVSGDDLIKVLSYRSINVRGVKSVIPLDPAQARASCDSLAMGIYSRLFNWLVHRVNDSLRGDSAGNGFIGILDIFGFEIFDQNSFEQLCINFANEKLQQQFNRTTFKEEEQLYVNEGIEFTHVEFIDNQVVCDLIEKPPKGLLPLLDDECIIPEGSDPKYMNKIEDNYKDHDKFQTDTHRKLDNSFNFEIVHYAGVVKYNGEGFMAKNMDSMFEDQKTMCNNSANQFVKQLFIPENAPISKMMSTKGNPKKTMRNKSKGTKSLSYQFRNQLNDLMGSLYETDSRYIRCVKPNPEQVPDKFISVMVNEQLTYSGVYEAVEIRKQGFPFRLNYRQFAARYSCINMEGRKVAKYNNVNDPKALCAEILERNRYDFSQIVFGKTMCLYKTNEHRLLTLLREFALEALIPMAQKAMRGHLARELYRRCAKCDEILLSAMKVGNDIDLIDDALSKVDPTLGPFLSLFPGVYPKQKRIAIQRREALQKWKELEAHFERLNKTMDGGEAEFTELDGFVQEARKILDTPRTEVQIALFDEAVEHRNALEIRLQTQRIEAALEHFSSLANYPKMRDDHDYTKKVRFMRSAYEEVRYTWQKSRLPHTVTAMGEDVEQMKAVKNSFEKIKEYSLQKKTKQEFPELAAEIIANGKQNPLWADEIWVHLIKMTTNNPSAEHNARVWELIAMALFTVQPSVEMEDFVVCHLRNAPDGSAQNYLSTFHQVKYETGYRDAADMTMPQQVAGMGRTRFSMRLPAAVEGAEAE